MKRQSTLDEDFSIDLECVRISQPIGDFYIASIDSAILRQITYSDVRRLRGDREIDEYLGIQREVNSKRVKEIGKYVNTFDACFPTAVILAVPARCAEFNESKRILTLKSDLEEEDVADRVDKTQIARVLDGQHRIEGLAHLEAGHPPFQINVSIFVEMDIESQAYLFSVVNLAQTKVSKSLVYDLFEYSKARSPQKTAHSIAVALDRDPTSPFFESIKRLGVATKGRFTETLTQATFVEALLPYLSTDPVKDRDVYLRGSKPIRPDKRELERSIFRTMFLDEHDLEIADVIYNFFSAAAARWPEAWSKGGTGAVLKKTNGFKGLMRLLKPAYLYLGNPGEVISQSQFRSLFARTKITDDDFNVDNFKPGTSGETALFYRLAAEMGLDV